ncbi:hypothetical protein NCCP2716_17150 [Sporosarcina sp. NCCP-2716]|uniref:hypothetical protein n=1 Tax=Sporosarcina sp. NCCP-2716 TaxID=2943679 RepID=UPI00203F3230|nr:hypothetical protein [Sporosarcina sp. NCCP-2716]GKV69217.1 hypothetical protein NCCP2716_17150 [Sporosarcina sp. NCCP-2716]
MAISNAMDGSLNTSQKIADLVADVNIAKTVEAQITAATNQLQVETARSNYNSLTTKQKLLVTNESALQVKEQSLVDDEAAKIIAAEITNLTTGTNVLTQARALVTAGFTVTITSSSNTAISSTTGAVTQQILAQNGNVTFQVEKYGKTATSVVALTVNPRDTTPPALPIAIASSTATNIVLVSAGETDWASASRIGGPGATASSVENGNSVTFTLDSEASNGTLLQFKITDTSGNQSPIYAVTYNSGTWVVIPNPFN